jgi:ribosomal protein S18 acetylase RimI-like enzyme
MFEIVSIEAGRGTLARAILSALPEWFGIPQSVDDYVGACEQLPMFAARLADGSFVGFLSVKMQTPVAAEALVLGVERAWHRRGCGRALFAAAETFIAARGARYLTVKTLAASDPDPFYNATRKFYEAIGFEPIEVFPTLWNADNPCLLMLKPIR